MKQYRSEEGRKKKNKRISEYNKIMQFQLLVRFNRKHDRDLIAYIKTIDNKAGYIKNLIKNDMHNKNYH